MKNSYSLFYSLKVFVCSFFLFMIVFPLVAFDWPQELSVPNSFSSFFTQNRGETFCTSLTFNGTNPVHASDSGRLLVTLRQKDASCSFFPSTLGNAVIIAHPDSLLTVYASLDAINIQKNAQEISGGTEIAVSGTSGWHSGYGSLEFQVIDTKNKTIINPLVLMPSLPSLPSLHIGKITAVDNRGVSHELSSKNVLDSGVYFLYRDDSLGCMPYKTSVTVNGALVQSLTYDSLFLYEQHLCLVGKDPLSYDSLYPQEGMQFLAEIHIDCGKSTITIQLFDILGNQKQISYVLDVK